MDAETFASKRFDFLILGGGTAGLLLAARLSEDPQVNVGVLEAGGDHKDNPIVNIPGLNAGAFDNPDLTWDFTTVPQAHAEGAVVQWARGKGLGGSSAINFGMFAHPSRADLDNWAALGNPDWSFDSLAPFFRKFETYHPPSASTAEAYAATKLDPALRGTDGPIHVSYCDSDVAWIASIWPETCTNAGLPPARDPRSGSAVGGFNQLTMSDPETKTRSYSASAFLWPNRDRPNLTVLTGAVVKAITWEKSEGQLPRASGAQFEVSGREYTVTASRDVILSCGAIKSPQVLELSGVGSRELLQRHGIEVVVDNPYVGENLHDHVLYGPGWEAVEGTPSAELLRDPAVLQGAVGAFMEHQAGPLASFPTMTSYVPLSSLVEGDEQALQEIVSLLDSAPADAAVSPLTQRQYALQRAQLLSSDEAAVQGLPLALGFDKGPRHSFKKMIEHPFDGCFFTLVHSLSRPFSRGSIHITSTNIQDNPAIDPNYLAHPLDLEIAARGVLHAQKLATTEPLASRIKSSEDGKKKVPLKGIKWAENIQDARDVARGTVFTQWHGIGTCAMAPRELGGVVDQTGRVHGTRGLRVCDASLFPIIPQGNTTSVVYAMSEKIADSIKREYGL